MSATADSGKIEKALQWVVSLLNRHGVPYQVVGGLAARAYGATRPVVDIDLYIPLEAAQAAVAEMKPYLVRPALPHRSADWDLTYLALDVAGVSIQIGDSTADPRYYNHKEQRWEAQVIDYAASQFASLFGVEVAVMPKDELVRYKTHLDRPVDRADLLQMDPAYTGSAGEPAGLSPYLSLELDLSAFDDRLYDGLIAGLQGEGFRFTSMAELGDTEEAQRKLYLLNDTTAMDMPGSDGSHAWPSFEDFRRAVCQMDWYQPGGQVVAIHAASGDWAAMSAITRFAGSGNTWNLHTGVDRRYRGRGLETAVLVLALRYARDVLRAGQVLADEGIDNPAMIEVYTRLGYVERQE